MADFDADGLDMIVARSKEVINTQEMALQRAALGLFNMTHVLSTVVTRALRNGLQESLVGTRSCSRGHSSWVQDNHGTNPFYTQRQFRLRFRVPRALLYRIRDALVGHAPTVWLRLGQVAEVNIMAVLRYVAIGLSFEDLDDGAHMSKESVRLYVRRFCKGMVSIFGSAFLNRYPMRAEMQKIALGYEESRFPGCIGAIDCMCIDLKNFLLEEKGKYHNPKDSKLGVVKVEAWCDKDLYFCHWFVGPAGTVNDNTMICLSILFINIFNRAYYIHPPVPYRITPSGVHRTLAYFLAVGIYPHFPIFVLPVHTVEADREALYTKRHGGRCKDKERAFGVIQARIKVLRNENFSWCKDEIIEMCRTCVIIHNMLVRINQKGHFVEDMEAENADFNIIDEMMAEDGDASVVRTNERRAAVAAAKVQQMSGDAYVEEMLLHEEEFSSSEEHLALQSEFMDRFSTEASVARAARGAHSF